MTAFVITAALIAGIIALGVLEKKRELERSRKALLEGFGANARAAGTPAKSRGRGFPGRRGRLYFCRKPMYSSSTLNSMSPEQTGSTASVPGMGTYSNRSRAPVSTRAGITS